MKVDHDNLVGGHATKLNGNECCKGNDSQNRCDENDGDRGERPHPRPDGEFGDGGDPAVAQALDEGEHDPEESQRDQHRADQVEALGPAGLFGFRYENQHADEHDDADRQVDQERPVPGRIGGEPSADQRAEGGHATDGSAPHSECGGACLADEDSVDDRQRAGQQHRGADALKCARADDGEGGRGGGHQHAGGNEDDETDDEQQASTGAVSDAAGQDQQGRERQRVGGRDPLGVGRGEPEVLDHRRDCDVDHRGVEDDHRHAQ